jgi:ABC-type transporter Mla MlaB component
MAHQLPDPSCAESWRIHPTARQRSKTMSTIELESDLGIEGAARLHAQLATSLDSKRTLSIDASKVDRLHAASMQVLVGFVRERNAGRRKTRITDPSSALRSAAVALGVNQILGIETQGARA